MDNVALAKPFVQAVISVLSAVAGISPAPGKPSIKTGGLTEGDNISAVIQFSGERKGVLILSFSQGCALALTKNILGECIEDLLNDSLDAVGEVTNMVSGQARANLNTMGINLQGSTPFVLSGEGCHLPIPTHSRIIAIPFTTEHGSFSLEFCLD